MMKKYSKAHAVVTKKAAHLQNMGIDLVITVECSDLESLAYLIPGRSPVVSVYSQFHHAMLMWLFTTVFNNHRLVNGKRHKF